MFFVQIKTAAWQLLFLLNVSAKTERLQWCKEYKSLIILSKDQIGKQSTVCIFIYLG